MNPHIDTPPHTSDAVLRLSAVGVATFFLPFFLALDEMCN